MLGLSTIVCLGLEPNLVFFSAMGPTFHGPISFQHVLLFFLQNNNCEDSKEHSSILSQLLSSKLAMQDDDKGVTNRHLEEDEILAHVLAMFGETFETSSNTLLFVLYELALHPEVQDRLYNEMTEMYEYEVRRNLDDNITKTRPCNIQQYFTAVKMLIFR